MPDKKRAQKVSHQATKTLENPSEKFEHSINGRLGDRRMINRILAGRRVKPCGRECREYGIMIASKLNHSSFQNFTELMNDEEFVLQIARITPNPTECENYFYQYINPYLRRKTEFRMKFLKEVYLNENVYKLADINLIVEYCGLEEENKIILNDMEFKARLQKRLEEVDYQKMVKYCCSGQDEKELHNYKIEANNMKVLCENIKKGLAEVLNTFAGEKIEIEEPQDYWSYICQQARNKGV